MVAVPRSFSSCPSLSSQASPAGQKPLGQWWAALHRVEVGDLMTGGSTSPARRVTTLHCERLATADR